MGGTAGRSTAVLRNATVVESTAVMIACARSIRVVGGTDVRGACMMRDARVLRSVSSQLCCCRTPYRSAYWLVIVFGTVMLGVNLEISEHAWWS